MKMKTILTEVRAQITPSYKEIRRLEKLAKEFITTLKKKGVTAHIGGSLAKGTMITKEGTQDVDIFAVFPNETKAASLGRILEKTKLPGKLRAIHGSRTYYQITCKEAILEIVPVVKKTDTKITENVTDFSLSHVTYIRKKIKEKPEITGEIRLAKTFCKAQNVYGAESYINGFSGYALEVLTIHYGSFIKLLQNIDKKRVIDPEKHYKTETQTLRELNGAKTHSPIILIDPTNKERNALAGLRKETYKKFLTNKKKFLKKPTKKSFEWKKLDVKRLQKEATKKKATLLTIQLETDRQEGDIAGTKMKKYLTFLTQELKRKKQKIIKTHFIYPGTGKKAKGYILVKEQKEIEIQGPTTKIRKEIIQKYKQTKKETYKKKGHWWHKEKTSIKNIFKETQKKETEMGAKGKLV